MSLPEDASQSDDRDERVRAAEEIVQELLRAFKARRLYDPGHPQRATIEAHSAERIRTLLELHGAIEFDVDDEALLCEDTPVYRQERGPESLVHLLHREGVRQIALYPGLTAEELAGFLDDVAASALAPAEAADLLSRLWTRSFLHLRYAFVEALSDSDWTPPVVERGSEEAPEEKAPIRLASDDREAVERPEILSGFESSLYVLDDEDLASLQSQLEAERESGLLREFLTCLREILFDPPEGDPTPGLAALADVQAHLLDAGDYSGVRGLHDMFSSLQERVDDERIHAAFAGLRDQALGTAALDRLARQLEAGQVTEATAAEFYRAFGRGDLAGLLARLGDVKRLCQRPVIAEAFADLVRADLEAVRGALAGGDPEAAAAGAFLAGLSGDPRLIDALGTALGSTGDDVRREALLALKQFGGRALPHVARAVDDRDPSIRLYALRYLVSHRFEPALAQIAELLAGDAWRERPLTERRLLFEAYGALGGESVVPDLERRLKHRGGLFRRGDPEEAACAVIALGAARTPSARALVERALDDRETLVRRAASQVLEGWDREAAWQD